METRSVEKRSGGRHFVGRIPQKTLIKHRGEFTSINLLGTLYHALLKAAFKSPSPWVATHRRGKYIRIPLMRFEGKSMHAGRVKREPVRP